MTSFGEPQPVGGIDPEEADGLRVLAATQSIIEGEADAMIAEELGEMVTERANQARDIAKQSVQDTWKALDEAKAQLAISKQRETTLRRGAIVAAAITGGLVLKNLFGRRNS